MNLTPNISAANTRAYPYWYPLGIQTATLIPGHQIELDTLDIPISNRIPGQDDYNESDLHTIPIPNSPNNDITSSALLKAHSADLGRGASIGLIELFQQTNAEISTVEGNR